MFSSSASFRWPVLVVLLFGVVAGGWSLWLRTGSPPVPTYLVSGNGRLESTAYDVATRIPGRLIALRPREGDLVVRGDELGQIDVRDLQAQLTQSEALVRQAQQVAAEARATVVRCQSEGKLASATLVRTQELVARSFLSPQRLDQDLNNVRIADASLLAAQSKVAAADSAVLAAEANVRRIQSNVDDASLRAPVSGRVLYRLAEPGEVLAGGARVLTVLDPSDVFMTIFVPAGSAGQIALGSEARLRVDALADQYVPAQVIFVAERAQFTPREVETRDEREKLMFRVKLRVDSGWLSAHPDLLKPGMPAVGWVRLDASRSWPDQLPER
ncbi:HlyD family efflux transporter periplasmic adaptor subunit [Azoarcus sp. L1K30]|nr:HlyD family efflux transporter periplasmic adaptor subunit [Azoarcus sp. L1K30]